MKAAFKLAFFTFFFVFVSMQILAQNSYNLKYKYEKGKTYLYRTNSNTDATQNMMGQEMTTNSVSKSVYKMEITDFTAGKFETIYSFDSLYSKTTTPQGDVENNGEGIVGKKTKMIYDVLGKKLQKIMIDTLKSNGAMDSGRNTGVLIQFPEKPVQVGEVWTITDTDSTKIGEDGKMVYKTKTDYKIEGKENKGGVECLKISVAGSVTIEGSMTQGGVAIVLEGTGKSKGFVYFNDLKGIINGIDTVLDVNMTAAVPDQNIVIPITQSIKSNVVLLGQ